MNIPNDVNSTILSGSLFHCIHDLLKMFLIFNHTFPDCVLYFHWIMRTCMCPLYNIPSYIGRKLSPAPSTFHLRWYLGLFEVNGIFAIEFSGARISPIVLFDTEACGASTALGQGWTRCCNFCTILKPIRVRCASSPRVAGCGIGPYILACTSSLVPSSLGWHLFLVWVNSDIYAAPHLRHPVWAWVYAWGLDLTSMFDDIRCIKVLSIWKLCKALFSTNMPGHKLASLRSSPHWNNCLVLFR